MHKKFRAKTVGVVLSFSAAAIALGGCLLPQDESKYPEKHWAWEGDLYKHLASENGSDLFAVTLRREDKNIHLYNILTFPNAHRGSYLNREHTYAGETLTETFSMPSDEDADKFCALTNKAKIEDQSLSKAALRWGRLLSSKEQLTCSNLNTDHDFLLRIKTARLEKNDKFFRGVQTCKVLSDTSGLFGLGERKNHRRQCNYRWYTEEQAKGHFTYTNMLQPNNFIVPTLMLDGQAFTEVVLPQLSITSIEVLSCTGEVLGTIEKNKFVPSRNFETGKTQKTTGGVAKNMPAFN